MIRVAVTGAGVVSALGRGREANYAAIVGGRSGVGRLTRFGSDLDVPVGEVPMSDDELRSAAGLPAGCYSRTFLLGLTAVREALADAGADDCGAVGLVSSTSVGGMDLTERYFARYGDDLRRGRLREVAQHDCGCSTELIAEHCGFGGFVATISTACSSAANAIMLGARLIASGRADRVVTGGTDALCRFTLGGFASLKILSPQPCRPFDRDRDGLNLGEGAGYLVLERADRAARRPYCYLSGWANANDAFHQTASSADGEGAFLAMSGALRRGGVMRPDYINVHGTATPNNDTAEAAALKRLFGDDVPPFSSTKPFTGHTLAAAGGIEAVLSVMALERGTIYPSLGFSAEDDGGLRPCTEMRRGVGIGSVLTNSFGFGGNDSSLLFTRD